MDIGDAGTGSGGAGPDGGGFEGRGGTVRGVLIFPLASVVIWTVLLELFLKEVVNVLFVQVLGSGTRLGDRSVLLEEI